MQFPGQKRADGVFAPLLEVEFRFPNDPRTHLALVDSGADWTIIPAELLPSSIVYADLGEPTEGEGVGGTFEMRRCHAEVWFQRWKVNDWFFVIEPGKMITPAVLLGRHDFMGRFTVTFDWKVAPGTVWVTKR